MGDLRPTPAYRQFSSERDRIVIYFHGAPGAPGEAALFDRLGKEHGLNVLCFVRFALDRLLKGEAYFCALAEAISGKAGGASVDLIGFSVGAFVALQTCRHLGDRVSSLHLVSAAAPLEAGDFLGAIASGGVFRLAQTAPTLFECLSQGQGLLARSFPAALFSLFFASAAGEDRALAADPEFQARMKETLRDCFVERAPGYIRDIEAYVQPWGAMLSEVVAETHIWHGKQDNWSPVGMAEELTLSLDEETGEYTRLTRFHPGADTRAFGGKRHPYPEEIFIVSGSLYDEAFGAWCVFRSHSAGDSMSIQPPVPRGFSH